MIKDSGLIVSEPSGLGALTGVLDPRLQRALLKARTIEPGIGAESVFKLEVSIEDDGTFSPDWLRAIGFVQRRRIGRILTGTVDLRKLQEIEKSKLARFLSAGRPLRAHAGRTIIDIRATPDQLSKAPGRGAMAGAGSTGPQGPVVDGSGVIIGIVDYGCDLLHPSLQRDVAVGAPPRTRLLYLWDQNEDAGPGMLAAAHPPAPYGYGREFDSASIDAWLAAPLPQGGRPPTRVERYRTLGYDPHRNYYSGDIELGAHGTHVLSIAGGREAGPVPAGVAPGADLIFVQLSRLNWEGAEQFGNSVRLMEAVDYIFAKASALARPCVINISLGTQGGAHDGSSHVEQALDFLLGMPGRAITLSAGNSYQNRSHAAGQTSPGNPAALHWRIPKQDKSLNELEIWYDAAGAIDVILVAPDGAVLPPIPKGATRTIIAGGVEIGTAFHPQDHPNLAHVDILLAPGAPAGEWTVRLVHAGGPQALRFHAWIERDDTNPSSFTTASNLRSHTIGSLTCGAHPIVVAGYRDNVPGAPSFGPSAAGPSADGKQKPDVCAPGADVAGACSGSDRAMKASGTSQAAPHVAGTIALMMQAAPRPLSIGEIRNILTSTARRGPPSANAWSDRYGHGRLDAAAAVAAARAII